MFAMALAAVPPALAREMLEELLWETGHRLRQWRRGHETAVDLAEAAAVSLVQGYHYPRPAGLACPKCRASGVQDRQRVRGDDELHAKWTHCKFFDDIPNVAPCWGCCR